MAYQCIAKYLSRSFIPNHKPFEIVKQIKGYSSHEMRKTLWEARQLGYVKPWKRWKALDKGNMRYPQVTLSPAFKLEDIRKQAKGQLQLTEYEEPEPTCSSINGGCFL